MDNTAWPGTVLQELNAPGFAARLLKVDWPVPNDCRFVIKETSLVLTLTPLQPCRKVRLSPDDRFADFSDAGDIVLMPGGMNQHCYGTGGPQHCLSLNIADDRMASVGLSPQDWAPQMLQSCLDIKSNAVSHALRMLGREVQTPGFAAGVMAESLSMQIIVELSRTFHNRQPAIARRGGMAPWQVKRIMDYVSAHLTTAPTVTELANVCGLSRRHIARAFKEATGETLSAYIERTKLEEADRLLRHTNLPMKVIAANLGYSSSGSFSTAFRRTAGISPSDFCKAYRTTTVHAAAFINTQH